MCLSSINFAFLHVKRCFDEDLKKPWSMGEVMRSRTFKNSKTDFFMKKNSFWFLNQIFLTYSKDVQSSHTFLMTFYTNLSKNNIYFIFILLKKDLKTHFQSSADSIWVDQRRISSPYCRIGRFSVCLSVHSPLGHLAWPEAQPARP